MFEMHDIVTCDVKNSNLQLANGVSLMLVRVSM